MSKNDVKCDTMQFCSTIIWCNFLSNTKCDVPLAFSLTFIVAAISIQQRLEHPLSLFHSLSVSFSLFTAQLVKLIAWQPQLKYTKSAVAKKRAVIKKKKKLEHLQQRERERDRHRRVCFSCSVPEEPQMKEEKASATGETGTAQVCEHWNV